MTVAELIEELRQFPQDAQVFSWKLYTTTDYETVDVTDHEARSCPGCQWVNRNHTKECLARQRERLQEDAWQKRCS